MYNTIAVINVRYSFHPELYWSLNRHEEGEKEASVRLIKAESIDEEEKERNQLSHNGALDKLSQNDFGSSMGKCTMLEE